MYLMYQEAAWLGVMPLISGSFKLNTATCHQSPLRQCGIGEPVKRHTCPPLGLPARIKLGDGTRSAVEAALHADEAEAAVAIGRGWRVCFKVITGAGNKS